MTKIKSKVRYDGGNSLQLLTFDAYTRRQLKSYMGYNGDLVVELEHWAALFKTWSTQEKRQVMPAEVRMALDELLPKLRRQHVQPRRERSPGNEGLEDRERGGDRYASAHELIDDGARAVFGRRVGDEGVRHRNG